MERFKKAEKRIVVYVSDDTKNKIDSLRLAGIRTSQFLREAIEDNVLEMCKVLHEQALKEKSEGETIQ